MAVLTTAWLALGVAPGAAQAAETYELRPYGTKCVSGQTDERRYLYVVCHNELLEGYLRVVRPDGSIERTFRVPGANDVAPSPDGSYLYVASGGTTPMRRYDRQADGSYVQSATWRPPTFQMWGTTWTAEARSIATDAFGNLYVADGVWTNNLLHVVVKFDPNGRYLTHFGGFRRSWETGEFYSLAGIAVSRDGRSIYTTELHNSRVQRFDRQADGSYAFALTWGNNEAIDPYRLGICAPTVFGAPYDVAVDGWGDVWVTSTSCTHLQKFDRNGILKFASFVGNRGTEGPGVLEEGRNQNSHNLAVDGNGNAISGETSTWLVRTGDPLPPWPAVAGAPAPEPDPLPAPEPDPVPAPEPVPLPGPDLAAPVVRDVTIPATTATSLITVTIDATDDVGVTRVRMATDNGDDWTAWQAFAPAMPFTLRAGTGYRGVYVQVRDAAGKESNIVYRRTNVTAVAEPAPAPVPAPAPAPGDPDRVAPTIRDVRIPATTLTREITVTIDAVDDRAVTQVRMATDNGDDWTAWQPYSPTMQFLLRIGFGPRGVYVQVRDAAGNHSNIVYRKTRVVRP